MVRNETAAEYDGRVIGNTCKSYHIIVIIDHIITYH